MLASTRHKLREHLSTCGAHSLCCRRRRVGQALYARRGFSRETPDNGGCVVLCLKPRPCRLEVGFPRVRVDKLDGCVEALGVHHVGRRERAATPLLLSRAAAARPSLLKVLDVVIPAPRRHLLLEPLSRVSPAAFAQGAAFASGIGVSGKRLLTECTHHGASVTHHAGIGERTPEARGRDGRDGAVWVGSGYLCRIGRRGLRLDDPARPGLPLGRHKVFIGRFHYR